MSLRMNEVPSSPQTTAIERRAARADAEQRRKRRSLQNRRAALLRHARSDPRENTKAARAGFIGRFYREVDEHEPGLPDHERNRRAEGLLSAYMIELSVKASDSRRRRSQYRRTSSDH